MSTSSSDWLMLVVIVAVIGGAGYWLWQRDQAVDPVPVSVPATPAKTPEEAKEPRFPVPTGTMQPPAELVELPPLNDSDAYFNLTLKDLFGEALDVILVESGGIERFVTTIDNLPRATLSERLRPVAAVGSSLVVEPAGDKLFELSAANFERYESYVRLFEQADMDAIVASYLRVYPLLQQAFEALGYPNAYFNDRLVEVIDHLLETPDVAQPVLLRRPHVLYEYADPALEGLSSGQKILIRTGPDATTRIKNRLAELRNRLTRLPQES